MTLRKSLIATATVLATGSCFADDGAYSQSGRQPVAVSLSAQGNDQGMQQGGQNRSMWRQGQDPMTDKNQAGYNQPARIKVNGKWNFNLNASFIYWHASEDGLDVAFQERRVPTNAANTQLLRTGGDMSNHTGSYKPGFKVGAGLTTANFDDWMINAQYTWYRSMNHESRGKNDPTVAYRVNNWFPNQHNIYAGSVSSDWGLHFQLIDLTMSRPFYQGSRLTVNPYAGLRSALIRQHFTVEMHNIFTNVDNAGGAPFTTTERRSLSKSNSWSIGPVFGMNSNWLLGAGFRGLANASAGILYTRYTTVSLVSEQSDTTPTMSFPAGAIDSEWDKHNALRPFLEFDLGLGWGRYFHDMDYFIDFSASYDFLCFPSQNMMRVNADAANSRTGGAPGDLYLHGLTVNARFDF